MTKIEMIVCRRYPSGTNPEDGGIWHDLDKDVRLRIFQNSKENLLIVSFIYMGPCIVDRI